MKKITLLFTIMCISTLNGMESYFAEASDFAKASTDRSKDRQEKPTYTYEETYGSLPAELKQEIINTALATSNSLSDAINAIKAFSALHGANYNQLKDTTLVNALMKRFPATVKDVIVFALQKPELYLKVATLLKENRDLGLDTIMEKDILQKNLNEFTVLIHMIDDQEKSNLKKENKKPINTTADLATQVFTPPSRKYRNLNYDLLNATNSTEFSELLNQGADINYSNMLMDVPHTPLSLAAIAGNVDLVRFLLNAGANPYFEIPETGTALDFVLQAIEEQKQSKYFDAEYSKRLGMIKSLLEQAMKNYPQSVIQK